MATRRSRRNMRKSRKASRRCTRKQSGGAWGFKNPFAKKPVDPAVAAQQAQAAANKKAAGMNAARKYVNAGLAAGKTGYQISSNARENSPPGVSNINVNAILKEKGHQIRSY